MNTILFGCLIGALALSSPTLAQEHETKSKAPAPAVKGEKGKSRLPGANATFTTNLAWQMALDGAHFSPGILDGKWGRKGDMALREHAAANACQSPESQIALLGVDFDHPTAPYTIGAADLAEVGELSEDWNERAKLDHLRYPTLHECLAEKFHCTQALLARLNPKVDFSTLAAGATVVAPNLRPFPQPGPMKGPKGVAGHRLKIDVVEKTIRAFNADGRQLALFHCSVAKDKEKLPTRNAVVKTMASPPDYTFDPKNWPEVHNVDRILTIKSGPRNPVGLAWIGLDLPGYGIHGNPKPELIGKTGSHGCFRMTNWDALALFSMVKPGMTVEIVKSPESEPEKTQKAEKPEKEAEKK